MKRRRERKRGDEAVLDHERWSAKVICTPARLSSVKWAPDAANVIGCGDYDGVVAEWDVERGLTLAEKDEHSGKKVWSIDYSLQAPRLCASASDDGTVRLWARGSDNCSATIVPPSGHCPVCSAQFSPSSAHLIALACSDSNIYLYDTRRLASPLLSLHHHRRAASYVRFLNGHQLVSASVDSTLKLWDVSSSEADSGGRSLMGCPGEGSSAGDSVLGASGDGFLGSSSSRPKLIRTYGAHLNVRNFVGLSAWHEGGLLACGSETNEAFAYDCRWVTPVLKHGFQEPQSSPGSEHELGGNASSSSSSSRKMVSAVCWRQQPSDCTLLAANSDGLLKILSGQCKQLL